MNCLSFSITLWVCFIVNFQQLFSIYYYYYDQLLIIYLSTKKYIYKSWFTSSLWAASQDLWNLNVSTLIDVHMIIILFLALREKIKSKTQKPHFIWQIFDIFNWQMTKQLQTFCNFCALPFFFIFNRQILFKLFVQGNCN